MGRGTPRTADDPQEPGDTGNRLPLTASEGTGPAHTPLLGFWPPEGGQQTCLWVSNRPSVVIGCGSPRGHTLALAAQQLWIHHGLTEWQGPCPQRTAPSLLRLRHLPGLGPILPTCQELPWAQEPESGNHLSPGSAWVPGATRTSPPPHSTPGSCHNSIPPAPLTRAGILPRPRARHRGPRKALPSRPALASSVTARTTPRTRLTLRAGDSYL